jgi:methyltransferase family protein
MSRAESIPGIDTGRDPLDFDRTPAGMVQAILPHLGQPRTVLDIGCGDGAIGKALRVAWGLEPRIDGVESDFERFVLASNAEMPSGNDVYDGISCRDWLGDAKPAIDGTPDLIISNPPYSLALPFLRRSLERVSPGGLVAFLLPIHWDTEAELKVKPGRNSIPGERQAFLDGLRLPDGREGYGCYHVVGRWGFRGNGSTAAERYAWYLIGPGHEGVHRRVAAPSPAESRVEQLALIGDVKPEKTREPAWNPEALEWEP